MAIGNHQNAIEWCKKGLEMAQHVRELDRRICNCSCMALAYEKLGNFEKALQYKDLNLMLQDSFLNANKVRGVTSIEAKHLLEEQKNSFFLAIRKRNQ